MTTEAVPSETSRPDFQFGENGDDPLRTTALKLLQSSGYAALRSLRCEVTEGVVMIHGVVPSYYLKQLAQATIQRLAGIQRVWNLVEVRRIEVIWVEDRDEDSFLSQTAQAGASSS
jgi:hypothetical protein